MQPANSHFCFYDILPDIFRTCRKYVGKQLGQQLTPALREVVKKFDASLSKEYSPDAESAAKRTLKNKALQMLSASGDPAVSKELLNRFREATNMTDTIAALTALIDSEGRLPVLQCTVLSEKSLLRKQRQSRLLLNRNVYS